MRIEPHDRMLDALPDLSPTAALDARVRARCHAAMAAAARQPPPFARAACRVVDRLLPVAVVAYAVAVLVAGLTLLFR
jgi:hypothetical protein